MSSLSQYKITARNIGMLVLVAIVALGLILGFIFLRSEQGSKLLSNNRGTGDTPQNVNKVYVAERTEPNKNIVCKNYDLLEEALLNTALACGLNLSNKDLSSIPPEILKLKNLSEIDLSNNNFSEFPEILLQLQKLYSIDLTNNKIVLLPTALSSSKTIQRVILKGNPLKEEPQSTVSSDKSQGVKFIYD